MPSECPDIPDLVGKSFYSFSSEGEGIGRNQKELKELQIFPIPYCNNLEQRIWREFSMKVYDRIIKKAIECCKFEDHISPSWDPETPILNPCSQMAPLAISLLSKEVTPSMMQPTSESSFLTSLPTAVSSQQSLQRLGSQHR
jgi:hypothetical protein